MGQYSLLRNKKWAVEFSETEVHGCHYYNYFYTFKLYLPNVKPNRVRKRDVGTTLLAPPCKSISLVNNSSETVNNIVYTLPLNATNAFKISVTQLTYKCRPLFGMRLIIVLTCVESPMGLTVKSCK
jgi:hypothetical protein